MVEINKGYNHNYNLVPYISLVFAGLGVGWLALNEIDSGYIYTTIFVVLTCLTLLGFLFRKENDTKTLTKMIQAPFTTDYDIAIPLFLGGWIVAFLFNLVLGQAFGFTVADTMIPFAQADIDSKILQSFSAVELSAEPFWRVFVMVFSAGSIEEFLFGFATMFIFGLVGHFVLVMINDGKDFKYLTANNFIFGFALICTMVIFSGIHLLNSTYSGWMFLIAMLFRMTMNMFIYKWGLFLSFTLGYHQANNLLYMWYSSKAGPDVVISALLSVKGLVIMAFYVLMLIYVIKNSQRIWKKIQGFPYS